MKQSPDVGSALDARRKTAGSFEPGAWSDVLSFGCTKCLRRQTSDGQTSDFGGVASRRLLKCGGAAYNKCAKRIPVKPSLSEATFRWTVASAPEGRVMGRECENCRELCMALTVASRHYVPNAPVRLHKRHLCSILNSQFFLARARSTM